MSLHSFNHVHRKPLTALDYRGEEKFPPPAKIRFGDTSLANPEVDAPARRESLAL